MVTSKSSKIFKHVLGWMRKNDIKISKVAVQKTLFFLKESGVQMQFDFGMSTYGPFSKQVVDIAKGLESTGEIIDCGTNYKLTGTFSVD